LKEKDLTLSIAKKIAALNSNDHIQILLSRDNDQSINVKDRVHFAKKHDADLFISIHINGAVNKELNGFSVLIDRNNTEKNRLLASAIINELKTTYKTANEIEIGNRGLMVVDSNACPAALVECGYITNSNDVAFISKDANQEKIAKDILNAINNYASSLNDNVSEIIINDSIPASQKDSIPYPIYYKGKKLKLTQYLDNNKKVEATYYDGSTEIVTKEEALKRGFIPPPPPPGLPPSYFKSKALFVINGKISSSKEAEKIDPNEMKEIRILKDNEAISKYGEKGKNGVIEINTKHESGKVRFVETDAKTIYGFVTDTLFVINGKESTTDEFKSVRPDNIESFSIITDANNNFGNNGKKIKIEITTKNPQVIFLKDTLPGKVFTKVEVEASFPGGPQAWSKYISRTILDSISKFTDADYGTCVIRFIVNVDGKVTDVIATTMKGTKLAKVSVNAIKSGPKWIPASQNGHVVAAYRLQPVTLYKPPKKVTDNPKSISPKSIMQDQGKVFIKLDQTATFPGGQSAWLKYISRVITQNGNKLTANRNNYGTCKVRFIIDKNGKVSDVQATTMKGTELAEVAVNAIKQGPKWIPGKQNGHVVNSYLIQPVTFSLKDKMIKNEPL
jgi:hypothetical protein